MKQHPIKTYRHAHGITLQALAERAGTTRSTISRVEAGLLKPTFDLLKQLIAAMNGEVSADEILAATPSGRESRMPEEAA